MKKISLILTCSVLAGLAQAAVVTTYMKPTSANLTSGALDASTASATFEWSANNATIQMTLLADGGNIFSDESALGVDNFRIGSTEGVTISFNVTADAGYQLDALSFERVRYASTDEGSTYTFTDNLGNVDNFTATATDELYYGFAGGADVQMAFVNVAPLTKDNQGTWFLHETTDTGTFGIRDFKVTTDISVIPATYPLYPRVNNLLTNDTPYDLTQETYQFEELWRIPKSSYTNMLDYMGKTPIVSGGTNTFIAYVDQDFRPVVTRIHATGTESAYIDNVLYQPSEFYANTDADPSNDVAVAKYYTVKPGDGHHNFSIGIDPQGYLHIVGDMHNYPYYAPPMEHLPLRYHNNVMNYWRSDNPYDISSFTYYGDQAAKSPQGHGFTYYTFFNDWDGELFMGARAMQASAKRCIAMSRYDVQTGNWSVVGGTVPGEPGFPRFFYEDAGVLDYSGIYSKTSLAGQFDRNNNLHCSAPTVGYDIEYPPYDEMHHTTHILYARSDDGGTSFVKADGTTPIVMPARVAAGTNQADFVYVAAQDSPTTCSEYINTRISLATDYREIPFIQIKEKFTNDNPNITFIMEWDQAQDSWVKHSNPSTRGASDYILQADPAGVLNWFNDDAYEMHRFWHPTNTAVTIELPWRFKDIDTEYEKQTGNILGVATTTSDLIIAKVIINRPGLDLIEATAETITNHPPEITMEAAINGTTLSVSAIDADGDPLTYTWRKSYGPGVVLFSANGTEASSNTTFIVSEEGTYEIKVEVSDGHATRISTCMAYLTVAPNSPVILTEASASPDIIRPNETSLLSVAATSTGDPSVFTWSKTSGPGDVSFSINGTTASSNTVASFSAVGTYELNVVITNSAGFVLSSCTVMIFSGDISFDDVLSNDWGGGMGWADDWTVTTGGVTPPDIVERFGNYAVRLRDGNNNQSITRTLATGIPGGMLTFLWDVDSMDKDTEYGYAEIYDGTWHTVWSMNNSGNGADAENEPDNLQVATIDLAAYGTVTQIRFRTSDNTGTGDYLFIDDVKIATKPYTFWAEENNLSGPAAEYAADPDGDGINNLAEYAFGGNPNTNDVAEFLPNYSMGEAGGTNWFNYIYNRRRDAAVRNLIYEVQTATNLISNAWTNNTEEAGSEVIDADFESATNRVPSDGEAQLFMRLEVEVSQ